MRVVLPGHISCLALVFPDLNCPGVWRDLCVALSPVSMHVNPTCKYYKFVGVSVMSSLLLIVRHIFAWGILGLPKHFE